jgi:DNA primase
VDTSTVDLLELIGRDVTLRKHAAKDGGEYIGACPFCGDGGKGAKSDRFHVWPKAKTPRYWCRICGKNGDAIQYVRQRHKLTYPEALDWLGLAGNGQAADLRLAAAPMIHPKHDPANPPSDEWQYRAILFCQEAEDTLWAPAGARALAWLRDERGLTDETIRGASLGYNPEDRREDRVTWGLPSHDDQGQPFKPVWLPRVNIRRPVGDPKYIGPAGWHDALYRADTLAPGAAAVLVEGELDALTVCQYAGEIAAAVATGSTAGARRAHWLAELALCGRVLVAFDGDPAGEEAAKYWLDVLTNARRWRAFYGKDANGLATAGGDLRGWVLAGLAAAYERDPAYIARLQTEIQAAPG